ncbi:MAG: NAD-dependent epimerase/dehydratase family protein [Verrucomicrobia bacterium]|nr:NAD-dependent epimerase/dehydratase family protein [Verrucomicrobiota bacterium]MBV8482469.1 NAD-dependent epimerase/dehydratase family protein [Verrucomicrobiota bacterium]
MSFQKGRALVTGGAGLIGSHVVDLLQAEGWSVRVLDNLEPQTHRDGKPPWLESAVQKGAQFLEGDMRDRDVVQAALDGIDVVFHQAAYGGYMPEISKYVAVNSFGTAQLLEIIRERKLGVRKVVVASSQVVYPEGAGECPQHGLVFPGLRPVEQLRRGDFSVRCPICQSPTKSVPTAESAPLGGETVYAITKLDQEKLVLTWGRQVGIPTVALRYSCTFGPRQSIFNPYTGVIAIFCTRLLNNLPPVIYEDGEQTRDFSFVADVAQANLLAATSDKLDGKAVNVGSNRAVTIKRVAEQISAALGIPLAPIMNGDFRPGEMRHLISDTTLIRSAGYQPAVSLEEGIDRYLAWIKTQGSIREYFAAAESILRQKGILQRVEPSR